MCECITFKTCPAEEESSSTDNNRTQLWWCWRIWELYKVVLCLIQPWWSYHLHSTERSKRCECTDTAYILLILDIDCSGGMRWTVCVIEEEEKKDECEQQVVLVVCRLYYYYWTYSYNPWHLLLDLLVHFMVVVIQKYSVVYHICRIFSWYGTVVEGRNRGRDTTNNDLWYGYLQ